MHAFNSIQFSAVFRWMLMFAVLTVPQVVQAQWRAAVGAQSDNLGRQALAFLPNEIWIHAGDSITWTFRSDEIHTVTFLKAGQVRPPFQVGCPGISPDGSHLRWLHLRHHWSAGKGTNLYRNFSGDGKLQTCVFGPCKYDRGGPCSRSVKASSP